MREGEIKATAALDSKKAQFANAMDKLANELEKKKQITPGQAKKLIAQFTGDDGVLFVPFDLTSETREIAQKFLLEELQAEDIRLAFVKFDKPGMEVAVGARSSWVVAAEGLEKKLRVRLIENQQVFPREQLNDLQIGVFFTPGKDGKPVAEIQLKRAGGKKFSTAEAEAVLKVADSLGYKAHLMGK